METQAANAYAAARKRVDSQLAEIQKLLQAFANKAQAEPRHWGFAGTMEHVSETLAEVVRSLSNGEESR